MPPAGRLLNSGGHMAGRSRSTNGRSSPRASGTRTQRGAPWLLAGALALLAGCNDSPSATTDDAGGTPTSDGGGGGSDGAPSSGTMLTAATTGGGFAMPLDA